MTNKKLYITVLVLLCMAAVCIYTIMGDSKTMTLTKPDGTTILLTHVSDHP